MIRREILSRSVVAILVAAFVLTSAGRAVSCPFCSAVSLTFAQEMDQSDAAVIAELVELPPGAADGEPFAPGLGDTLVKSKFRVLEVLKGAEHLKKVKNIETIYFGDSPVGTQFLVMGIEPPKITWSTPIALSKRGRQYVAEAMKLPESGADRLAFFLNHLEDKEEMLRRDSYDEFAVASYDDLKALAPRMPHAEFIARIKNPDIPGSRRRLYFTMLGVCGSADDLPLLEGILQSNDRKQKEGLDAAIGCYLAIKGAKGLGLIEELFLKNKDAEFIDTNAAIQAVRIAEESGIIAKDNAASALRHMLDRPQMADLVIPDLARWQDWTVMDQLVDLFLQADDESSWVRVPVLRYLQVCPLPEAKQQLAKLEKVDPDSAKRATAFPALGGLLPSGAKAPAGKSTPADSGAKATTDTTATGKGS